jgi:hypothetical protein
MQAQPPPPPPPPTTPSIVELKFDSLPKAGVYVEGHSAELCRTPCAFNVNLGDGGPTDRRTFIVRADGYRDKPVLVDLKSGQRDYSVSLEQSVVEEAEPPRKGTKTGSTKKKVTKTPAEKKPPVVEPEDKPAEKPPEPVKKKPNETIDPTDTVDPFHH